MLSWVQHSVKWYLTLEKKRPWICALKYAGGILNVDLLLFFLFQLLWLSYPEQPVSNSGALHIISDVYNKMLGEVGRQQKGKKKRNVGRLIVPQLWTVILFLQLLSIWSCLVPMETNHHPDLKWLISNQWDNEWNTHKHTDEALWLLEWWITPDLFNLWLPWLRTIRDKNSLLNLSL